jgi:membrane protein implicated in regulation of membrane protease activity
MLKDKKVLLIGGAFLGVLLVGGGVFFLWRQRKPVEVSKEALPEQQQQQRGPLVTPPPAEETVYETFTTADGRFSLEYPTAWIRADIKNLESILPKNFVDKYKLAMPLILSDPRGAQITLSVYQFEKGATLAAAMDSFRADLVAMGQPYNEVSRQTVGEMMVVDSAVDAGQGVTVKVRDLLFLVPGETTDAVYNISFSAREPNWGDYEAIFNHVQTSAELSL